MNDSPQWLEFINDTYPVVLQHQLAALSVNPSILTCEVVKKNPTDLLVKTNPPSASVYMQQNPINPPYDIVVKLGPGVQVPPAVKAGSLVSIPGKYTAID